MPIPGALSHLKGLKHRKTEVLYHVCQEKIPKLFYERRSYFTNGLKAHDRPRFTNSKVHTSCSLQIRLLTGMTIAFHRIR